jgi:hypothetical protein
MTRSRLECELLEGRFLPNHVLGEHIHPTLQISILGELVAIPTNIGITPDRTFSPHTHDTAGTLHIGENNPAIAGIDPLTAAPRLVTLKDFFDVWRTTNPGTPQNRPDAFFDSTRIFGNFDDDTHDVVMTVNGQPNTEFQNYSPHDGDAIVISYQAANAVNQRPTANAQSLNARTGTARSITLGGDDGDADAVQALTFRIQSLPSHGTLRDSGGNVVTAGSTLSSPAVTYTASDGFTGPDQFTFNVQDSGGTANGGQDTSTGAIVSLNVVNSQDPNDLQGPAGVGPNNSVGAGQAMPFRVRFENFAGATAPAQEITVHTNLDADLDWSTFEFGNIGFAQMVVAVPPGSQGFQTSLDVTALDGTPLRLDIQANLDAATGIATWSLRAVDPATGSLPDDPMAGFLYPNDATHRGDGFLECTVQTRTDCNVGTGIDASAAIIFDTNPVIVTNTLSYTIGGW